MRYQPAVAQSSWEGGSSEKDLTLPVDPDGLIASHRPQFLSGVSHVLQLGGNLGIDPVLQPAYFAFVLAGARSFTSFLNFHPELDHIRQHVDVPRPPQAERQVVTLAEKRTECSR